MNPFLIEGPASILFSGGRSSGYMLWRILDAHDGKATFHGFKALPAPKDYRPWRAVFEYGNNVATEEAVTKCYRELAAKLHPDKSGGSHEAMTELNRARDEALKEIG